MFLSKLRLYNGGITIKPMALINGFILYSSNLNQIYCNTTTRSSDTGGKGDAKYLWILKHFFKCFQFLVCKWTSLEMEFISHIYNFWKGPIFHKVMDSVNCNSDSQGLRQSFLESLVVGMRKDHIVW